MRPRVHFFDCAFCGKPVRTFWHDDIGGVTRGMYRHWESVLLGDYVAHPKCFEKSYDEYMEKVDNDLLETKSEPA